MYAPVEISSKKSTPLPPAMREWSCSHFHDNYRSREPLQNRQRMWPGAAARLADPGSDKLDSTLQIKDGSVTEPREKSGFGSDHREKPGPDPMIKMTTKKLSLKRFWIRIRVGWLNSEPDPTLWKKRIRNTVRHLLIKCFTNTYQIVCVRRLEHGKRDSSLYTWLMIFSCMLLVYGFYVYIFFVFL